MFLGIDLQYWILVAIQLSLAPIAALHAMLNKSEPRAALSWIFVCLIFPVGGPIMYFLFGINRVRTRAQAMNRQAHRRLTTTADTPAHEIEATARQLKLPAELAALARASHQLTDKPPLKGNDVELLENGVNAYPEMLAAIDGARRHVYLTTYLFQTDRVGRRFIGALGDAVQRGVDVRVVLDGFGEWYSFPWAGTLLKWRKVRVARFLPPRIIPPSIYVNLRNHRKILVVDGRIAFTGGMNISRRHADSSSKRWILRRPMKDLHFRLRGPVVAQIEQAFMEDWGFVTGEEQTPPDVPHPITGPAICRVVTDGPVEELDKLATLFVSAVASAREKVTIVTPYFLPSRELVGALISAALRGIDVNIVLPSVNNQPLVHWASRNMLLELLYRGVRVRYQPPPFAHTKLLLVDNHYTMMGSANVDPRSLRLNFEMNVELYGAAAVFGVSLYVDRLLERTWDVTEQELEERSPLVRVRDAIAWLMSPYL